MLELVALQPVDYLAIGHLAVDLTPAGPRLGGTVTYSALTARALGLRVGIVTAAGPEAPLGGLEGIPVVSVPSEHSTTFENIQSDEGRRQILHHRAAPLSLEHIPAAWRGASIMHVAPLAQEISSDMARGLTGSLVGVTPQGWLRTWDADGHVEPCLWEEAEAVLPYVGAAVISRADVGGDEEQIERMAHTTRVLAVTESSAGVRLYWHGDQRRFRAPRVEEVDSTGAGDIFAAAFFYRMYTTRDPWEAARFATHLASYSVTRTGLDGIPTQAEIQESLVEVLS
ncbi:MAG TPA: PfkB family carbohydrate kinase [Anaerolineales bacterium]|jgi:sugar/nucleoside kinase (ribokinase family)